MSFVESKGNMSSLPRSEPTYIKYNGGVVNSNGEAGSLFNKPNLVARSQKLFQSGSNPIHLKTPRDRLIVSGVMYGTCFGLIVAGAWFAKIAMPKRN